MDKNRLLNPDCAYYPYYTWNWNGEVTKAGIDAQLEEFLRNGIRNFYIIGFPQDFNGKSIVTSMKMDYLSDDYCDLLRYATKQAWQRGMNCWLYNEGGFPSGMAGGAIVREDPSKIQKMIKRTARTLCAGEPYAYPDDVLAVFNEEQRLSTSFVSQTDCTLTEYRCVPYAEVTKKKHQCDNADIADTAVTDRFLTLTHETLLRVFGREIGTRLTVMFDDEASMGNWTDGFETIFRKRYGYDILDYLPWIFDHHPLVTRAQRKAMIDTQMLYGELVKTRYLKPSADWLHQHGMLSAGHFDRDNFFDGFLDLHYGNVLDLLRCYDIPGIDEIWQQIHYSDNGLTATEGYSFYPLLASSAARQNGTVQALCECFAVSGGQMDGNEMRMVVSVLAAYGINVFNFMSVNYTRDSFIALQIRPNFIEENCGMNTLSQLNDYTARLSDLMQHSTARVSTALYIPYRSLCVKPSLKQELTDLGNHLVQTGVVFDLIDEAFVRSAVVKDGRLCGTHVAYDHVLVPSIPEEEPDVTFLLSQTDSSQESLFHSDKPVLCRCQDSGDESYFYVMNPSKNRQTVTLTLKETRPVCQLDLNTGLVKPVTALTDDSTTTVTLTLYGGEGTVLLFGFNQPADEAPLEGEPLSLTFEETVSRIFSISSDGVIENRFPTPAYHATKLTEWEADFSGEVTYRTRIPDGCHCSFRLELGEVHHYARVFLDGKKIETLSFAPYQTVLRDLKGGEWLTVTVANTPANALRNASYFKTAPEEQLGSYQGWVYPQKEAQAPAGGLMGPVRLVPLR